MLNKLLVIINILAISIFAFVLIILFNSKMNEVFDLQQIENQKEILVISLNYNKKLIDLAGENEKIKLRNQYNLINKQQAYLWLLDTFKPKIKNNIIISIVALSFLLIIILIFILLVFTRQYITPIQQIINSLESYEKYNKVEKVHLKGSQYIKKILTRYNFILEKLLYTKINDRIKNSIQSWQATAKVMAHEMKNQLSPVTLTIDSMIHYKQCYLSLDEIQNMKSNIVSIERLMNSLKEFSNLPDPVCRKVEVNGLIKKIINSKIIPESCIQVIHKRSEYFMLTDSFYLELILTNIIKNAYEACDKNQVQILIELKDATQQSIRITDNGSGIKKENIKRIFKPGFTTKQNGDGVGLFVVRELSKCLNINIKIESEMDSGTSFILEINNE